MSQSGFVHLEHCTILAITDAAILNAEAWAILHLTEADLEEMLTMIRSGHESRQPEASEPVIAHGV